MMAANRSILAVVIVCIAGCRDGDKPASPPRRSQPPSSQPATSPAVAASEASSQPTTPPAVAASEADLNALITKHGSVTFRSFDGKWIGRDSDTEVTFLPRGAVHVFKYGAAVNVYHGTYAIDPRGVITLKLPTYGGAWPAMSLLKDATSPFLVHAQDADGIVMGNRGGVTFAPYFPFRPLNPGYEAQVRARINTQR
jgi:hypothetical protein